MSRGPSISIACCASQGLVAVREELGLELLDAGRERGVRGRGSPGGARLRERSGAGWRGADTAREHARRGACARREGQREYRIDHPRAGDLIAIASPDAWFTYYYWLDDARAPDFARTVDIHRKPGYDPVELFLDPAIAVPAVTVGWKLATQISRIQNSAGRHSARCDPRQGLTRPAPRRRRRGRAP